MILIVASEIDTVARDIASHWANGDAVILTPRDVCTSGWRIELGAFNKSQIVASGITYPISDVKGVVVLLPYVMEYELVTIEESERKYVASEVTAFLFYFLSRLDCPVLNRPTAHCLVGPSWTFDQWNAACLRAGIMCKQIRTGSYPEASAFDVGSHSNYAFVIGGKCVGAMRQVSRESALELARLAGVEFLALQMAEDDQPQVIRSVALVPDLRKHAVLKAVRSYFMS